ncbi:MAG: FG-GAP repeat protein [Pirellulaceae bacterium]|nr:FG-GAP repeat protein [Pirellulaceae bacterium]
MAEPTDAPPTTDSGESYIIFGKSSGFAPVIPASSLDGTNGFRIDGRIAKDFSGNSVSHAGDVNGDGFDDLIIGAWGADQPPPAFPDAPPRLNAGKSYVVFGGNFTPDVGTQVGNSANKILFASRGAAVDRLIGGLGNDQLYSDAGSDVLIGGQGDDALVIRDADFSGRRHIDGGNGFDTLVVLGAGHVLNLPAIADSRIVDIEAINLDGDGNNSLILNYREVLNLSSTSNVLYVLRNAGDDVDIGTGWTQVSDHNEAGLVFSAYVQGAAILRVQKVAATASVVGRYVYYAGSSFAASGVQSALDTVKVLAQAGTTSQVLGANNLINSSRGINGLGFDIAGLPSNLKVTDFQFQMSPQGVCSEAANPVSSWATAPTPTSISVVPGATARVVIS